MKSSGAISCIIPTYNGVNLLQKHLPSVLSGLFDGDQLIICDDASSDTTLEWLNSQFELQGVEKKVPHVPARYTPQPSDTPHSVLRGRVLVGKKRIDITVVSSAANLRFGAAVNLAACYVSHPYFLLLNNDVSLDQKTTEVLREQIQLSGDIFAIGCLEFEHKKGTKKSGKNKIWFERGLFRHSKADTFESGPTAWASGGSALFSRDKWMKLHGFDPLFYPAYWEDIDLSWRARKKGWQVLFNADAVVYHQHESTNTTALGKKTIEHISWQNSFKFTWRHSSLMQRILFLIWYPYWLLKI